MLAYVEPHCVQPGCKYSVENMFRSHFTRQLCRIEVCYQRRNFCIIFSQCYENYLVLISVDHHELIVIFEMLTLKGSENGL